MDRRLPGTSLSNFPMFRRANIFFSRTSSPTGLTEIRLRETYSSPGRQRLADTWDRELRTSICDGFCNAGGQLVCCCN